MERRDQPERSLREEAKVRTQSRVALLPNLERVNAAASQAAQTNSSSAQMGADGGITDSETQVRRSHHG